MKRFLAIMVSASLFVFSSINVLANNDQEIALNINDGQSHDVESVNLVSNECNSLIGIIVGEGEVNVNGDVVVENGNENTTSASYGLETGVHKSNESDATTAVTIDGSLNVSSEGQATGILEYRNSDVTVTGDVNVTADQTGGATVVNSSLNVVGDVNVTNNSNENALHNGFGAEASVDDNYSLHDAEITIGGDVNVGGNGRLGGVAATSNDADNKAIVEVGGSVIVQSETGTPYRAVDANGQSAIVSVAGDVTGVNAISAMNGGTVTVGGDSSGNISLVGGDIHIAGNSDGMIYITDNGSLVVDGDISTGGSSISISKPYNIDTYPGGNVYIEANELKDGKINISTDDLDRSLEEVSVVVWKVGNLGWNQKVVSMNDTSNNGRTADDEHIERAQNIVAYKIYVEDGWNDTASIANGSVQSGSKTAKAGETVDITVSPDNGYEVASITSGTGASLQPLGNGVYRLTVPVGGGINIKTVLQAIQQSAGNSDNEEPSETTPSQGGTEEQDPIQPTPQLPDTSEEPLQPSASPAEDTSDNSIVIIVEVEPASQIENEQANNSNDSSDVPLNASSFVNVSEVVSLVTDGTEAVTRVAKIDVQQLTTAQYQEAVINNITATPSGTTLRLETNTVSVLDRNIINALEDKPTIDVEIVFTYNGQKYKVIIPRGYDVKSLLDDKGYCGFLRLASILGSQIMD